MAIVVASGTVHFVMSAVGAAVRVAMHGTSRRTKPSRPKPRLALARPSSQPSLGKGHMDMPVRPRYATCVVAHSNCFAGSRDGRLGSGVF